MKAQPRSPVRFMLVAGEPSGDLLAAELVQALRREHAAASPNAAAPEFIGAGGVQMRNAGVKLLFDLTQHAVVGLAEVLKHYGEFKRLFDQLVRLALEQQPDVIICVDFSGFNRRLARQIRWELAVRGERNWRPRLVQYVSPQVWASRPGRATAMARDFDLLLAIFPFEAAWYSQRVPKLRVEFVGHPIMDRYAKDCATAAPAPASGPTSTPSGASEAAAAGLPQVLLLPGSRRGELQRHWPVMLEAAARIHREQPVRCLVVVPNEDLARLLRIRNESSPSRPGSAPQRGTPVDIQVGGLAEALRRTDLAIASTGTVTLECAYFGVPTIAIYKTSWSTYQIGRRIIQVRYLAMPNLLADGVVFPEFIQDAATPENLARESVALLRDPERRRGVRARLAEIVRTLGGPGASQRAAKAVLGLLHA